MSTNTDAFLATLRACEGTAGHDGYRTLFGGKLFDGYVDHPNVRAPFVQTDGKLNYTTAAGAYQITHPTWLRLKQLCGFVDFTPQTQDDAALKLISMQGALADVEEGNFQAAIDKCATIWASLPASRYPQPTRTYAFAAKAYSEAGGTFA